MSIRDLEKQDAGLELDPQTQEWLETFEGPSVALLAEGVRSRRAPVTAFELKLDPWTADWLKSRRNSRTVLSFALGSAQQPPRRGPSSSTPRRGLRGDQHCLSPVIAFCHQI
jgi:hypothetical protein